MAHPNEIANPASIRQLKFVLTLLGERDLSSITNEKYIARMDELRTQIPPYLGAAGYGSTVDLACPMTTTGAHTLIDGLLDLPKTAAADAVKDHIPAGYYAIDYDGELTFWCVDKPTEGRWSGYTFVKRVIGPEKARVSRTVADIALSLIGRDPKAAALRYGHEIGRCSICNKRLTNKASRDAGIGPICAEKF